MVCPQCRSRSVTYDHNGLGRCFACQHRWTIASCAGCATSLAAWVDCDGDWHWVGADGSEWCPSLMFDAHEPTFDGEAA